MQAQNQLTAIRSQATFSHARYAISRPSYPPALYKTVLAYHQGPRALSVDLGTGHGLVSRFLAPSFSKIIGTDPSPGMIKQARALSRNIFNLSFEEAPAESLPFIKPHTVDLVSAAQAAHWFDYPALFPEMARIVRPGGTLAFWGYKDHVLVDYPRATEILNRYAYGADTLGGFWGQPGRSIVQGLLRAVNPPADMWEEVQRIEYEPGSQGPRTGKGTMFMNKRMKLGEMEEYIRTWSSVHAWKTEHPEAVRKLDGGSGDIVDVMMEEIIKHEAKLQTSHPQDLEVEVEWGSVLLLARKK